MKFFHKNSKVRNLNQQDCNTGESKGDLLKLCGNDDSLYEALSFFLLLDPKRSELQLGTVSDLMQTGKRELETGRRLQARVSFETAAKIGLYHEDKINTEKAIKLAELASDGESEARHRIHKTLLSELEQVISVARRYYGRIDPDKAGRIEKLVEVKPLVTMKSGRK